MATRTVDTLIAAAEAFTHLEPARITDGPLSKLALLVNKMKRASGLITSQRTPKARTDWMRGQSAGQTQSEFLARMTPDVVAADWERRRMAL